MTLPINMGRKPYEMIDEKKPYALIDERKPSLIKKRVVDLTKKTASATKERAKARGIVAGEVAAGGVVASATSAALGGITASGATAVVLSAAPVVAGFAAACVTGGILKTVIDATKNDDEK